MLGTGQGLAHSRRSHLFAVSDWWGPCQPREDARASEPQALPAVPQRGTPPRLASTLHPQHVPGIQWAPNNCGWQRPHKNWSFDARGFSRWPFLPTRPEWVQAAFVSRGEQMGVTGRGECSFTVLGSGGADQICPPDGAQSRRGDEQETWQAGPGLCFGWSRRAWCVARDGAGTGARGIRGADRVRVGTAVGPHGRGQIVWSRGPAEG